MGIIRKINRSMKKIIADINIRNLAKKSIQLFNRCKTVLTTDTTDLLTT